MRFFCLILVSFGFTAPVFANDAGSSALHYQEVIQKVIEGMKADLESNSSDASTKDAFQTLRLLFLSGLAAVRTAEEFLKLAEAAFLTESLIVKKDKRLRKRATELEWLVYSRIKDFLQLNPRLEDVKYLEEILQPSGTILLTDNDLKVPFTLSDYILKALFYSLPDKGSQRLGQVLPTTGEIRSEVIRSAIILSGGTVDLDLEAAAYFELMLKNGEKFGKSSRSLRSDSVWTLTGVSNATNKLTKQIVLKHKTPFGPTQWVHRNDWKDLPRWTRVASAISGGITLGFGIPAYIAYLSQNREAARVLGLMTAVMGVSLFGATCARFFKELAENRRAPTFNPNIGPRTF